MPGKVVSPEVWQQARDELLKEEKAATRLLGDISKKRRELPMVQIENPTQFVFEGPNNTKKTLVDLFENRRQLMLYHFMLKPDDKEGCTGCSFLMDHIPNLNHLHSRDTSFAAVAKAPPEKVEAFKKRMDWEFPFYSSGKTFTSLGMKEEDVIWKPGNGYFGLQVFMKEGDKVYHTWATSSRGVETMLTTYAMLDMTPLGRQEGNSIGGFLLHDQY